LIRLRVAQNGPPGIDHLDSLVLEICNDDSYWPDERNVAANGRNYDEVRTQVWAPYRFTPGTGPGQARADRHGRKVAYKDLLPVGQELAFQLEPTRPGSWIGMRPEEWQRQRGNAIRLAITAAHRDHGTWRLAGNPPASAATVEPNDLMPSRSCQIRAQVASGKRICAGQDDCMRGLENR